MAKYDIVVIERILSIYREWTRTDQIVIDEELKKVLMTRINPMEFRCIDDRNGILAYELWAMPIILNEHPTMDLDQIGEGLMDSSARNIFDLIRVHTFANALVDIYEGKLTDKMYMFAGLIESGRSAGVLPRYPIRRHKYSLRQGIPNVNELAMDIWKKRMKDAAKT